MRIHFKITERLLHQIRHDLNRPHPIAFERVGFVVCKGGNLDSGVVVLARSFHAVADEDYEVDKSVGARIGSKAVQAALAHAYNHADSMFFVHEHAHEGKPTPSPTDLSCWRELIPNFWHVRPDLPHGALVLSLDKAMGVAWMPGQSKPIAIERFSVVGRRLQRW